MGKKKNLLKLLTTEKKVTNWKMHKRKKAMVFGASVLAIGLGSAGLIYANAQSTASVASLPTDTTVNWENNKPLYYEIDQNGVEHPKPMLTLSDGTPAWCLGLGVPLPNNTTQAQLDASNAILKALSDEQIAVLNNVAYLAQKDGSLLAYAEAQHATYILLDEAGVSQNQTKDLIVKDNTLLNDANAIKTGANNLITEAKKMTMLPSFNGSTVNLIQGAEKTVNDTNGVLSNFPYFKSNVDGVSQTSSGNNLKIKADISSKLGLFSKALQFQNKPMGSADLPYYVYSTDGDGSGKNSQSVMATRDPSKASGSLNINIIGLGEIKATKVSANSKFDTKLMAGAEYSFFYKDGSPVKWTDGQSGYAITTTNGTKANDTNVVLKVGEDGTFGVKNLQNDKAFYFVETKAPKGFALDETKHAFSFDENSSFNTATSNYHVDGESKETPTGSTTLQKLDADTNSTETQGEAKWDGIVYGLFNAKADSPVKWTDGLKALPISITNGTKANDTNVELSLDKDNKVGVQNLNLASSDQYYWKEVRTSEGYSLSTKKIPVNFTGKESVDVTTNDFANNQKAQDKVLAFQLRFWKAQSVNDSLTGLDGAGFTLTPQNGTKGKAIKAVSKSSTDSDGFTKNGFVLFDGKANVAAGNANADGLAIGDYLLEETDVPKGTQAINPISVTSTPELNKDGSPKSYTVVLKDTVTGQQISSTTIEADKLTDNNLMFKLDLGTLTDKPVTPVVPTIKTKAKTADGNQAVDLTEVSTETPLTDVITLTNGELGDKYLGHLHRLVKDKNGEILDDKVVSDQTVTLDAEAVKSQSVKLTAKVDTTKDSKEKAENTVSYVWTGELFDDEQDIKVDTPEATHDDLNNTKQTLTVEKAPTIKTKAHTEDGNQTIEKVEVSTKTPVYDDVIFTNAEKGDQMVAQLHRIVTDKDGKETESKVVSTLNFTVDDFTVKEQEKKIQTEIDTTKDKDVAKGSTVTYVWTEELFDEGTNPKTDKPEAKHDDLKNQDQTLTVEEVPAPTIKTKAHTKDGDQKIENAEISTKTPVYDDVVFTNAEKGDQMVAQLHRIVMDKDGKETESKVISTLNFTVDDFTVKEQEKKIETAIDTTKDKDVPEGSTVTYVWTEELFDEGTNPKTDKPEAEHNDLKNKDQTLTVVYNKPTATSATPAKGVMPKTGESNNPWVAYAGMAVIALALGAGIYYYKKNKATEK